MKYRARVTIMAILLFGICCRILGADANSTPAKGIMQLEPIALWQFESENARVLLDETEQYVGLAQGGVSFTTDGAVPSSGGHALSFDGKNSCVVVRHHDRFLLEQGSVVCWLRADDVTRSQGVLSKDASGFGDGGHLTLSIAKSQIVLRLQSATESYELRKETKKSRWTHVACTFGSNGLQLFVDGQLAATHEYAGGLGKTSGGDGNHEPLVFGASTMTSQAGSESPLADFFHGALDEVALFARQLSAGEVAELASAAKPNYTSLVRAYVANDPEAWWRLDEPDGEVVAVDQVGQQHGQYNVIGSAHFDGDDFVDLGAIDLDESFTILVQIEPASFAVSDARIVAKENGLNEDDQFWSLGTTIRDDRPRIRFRLRTDKGTREAVSRNHDINLKHRSLIAAVYDGHSMRVYQDGALVSKVPHQGKPKTNAHCHVWIGDSPSGAGKRPFDGDIKDVAILRTAISAEQIKAISDSLLETAEPAPPVSSPEIAAIPEVPESLPLPTADEPAPIPAAPIEPPRITSPALPFVHSCPLCGVLYQEVPIRRVALPGTPPLPFCEHPDVEAFHP
ncbi:MAG TPA: LamG domain-containing protein [Pirellulaceae bacterium]|nr:LamG domain-containing protein [Pirellulaceae bacterium]